MSPEKREPDSKGEERRAGFEASNVAGRKNVAGKTNVAGVGITREREIHLIWGEIERDDLICGEERRAGFEASIIAGKKKVAGKTLFTGVGITRERERDIRRQTDKSGKTKSYISYNFLR